MLSLPKKILLIALVSLIVYFVVMNLLEQTTIRYLPWADPIKDVPVLAVLGISFGTGWFGANLHRWWRALRKKTKKAT